MATATPQRRSRSTAPSPDPNIINKQVGVQASGDTVSDPVEDVVDTLTASPGHRDET